MKNIDENIYLIDKPEGITSFDCIRIMRKKLGIKKIGHAGTLDPLATGLMILGANEGTKTLNNYSKLSKIYRAVILLGEKRSTGDMEGEVIEESKVGEIKEKEVEKTLKETEGVLTIKAPLYSAIKVGGKKLYKAARKGEYIEPPEREMEIKWIKLYGIQREDEKIKMEVEMKVGSGAYVRSIAEDIGRRLGHPAVVYNLRRIQIGDYRVEDANYTSLSFL